MSYNASTTCSFKRMHICQYCGQPIEYEINKRIRVSDETEAGVIEKLNKNAQNHIQSAVKVKPCPQCGMVQNCMIFRSFYTLLIFRFLLVLGLGFYGMYMLSSRECDFTFIQMIGILYAGSILFLGEMFFQMHKIRVFFRQTPESLKENVSMNEDAIETYRQTRSWYKSLGKLLVCGIVVVLIPFLGFFFGGLSLLLYYICLFWMPFEVINQGFPLFVRDIEFSR